MGDQRNQKQHQENYKQQLCNASGGNGNARKT
jgi:hypothetical protein